MKRLHVHVSVDDLAASVRFYNTLFAAEPESRIRLFTSLPIRSPDRIRLQQRLDAIARGAERRE
jgi:catechol 2,3-dioxygenase-like lactoylglutathione lyase family enzyme